MITFFLIFFGWGFTGLFVLAAKQPRFHTQWTDKQWIAAMVMAGPFTWLAAFFGIVTFWIGKLWRITGITPRFNNWWKSLK